MEPVVAWAIGIALFVFGLGMISAISSRSHRSGVNLSNDRRKSEGIPQTSPKNNADRAAMRMAAARGLGNINAAAEELETRFGGAMAEAGQGTRH